MCNEGLVVHMPKWAMIIGFRDDLAIVTVTKQPDDIEVNDNETINATKGVAERSVALITNGRRRNMISIRAGGQIITPKPVTKYLSVMTADEETANSSAKLARLMTNIAD